jgi:maleate isomerase
LERRQFLGLASWAAIAASVSRPTLVHAVQDARWKPDGAGLVARIGVLIPDFDPVPESEISAMAPDGVSIHGSRVVRYSTPAGFAEPPHVDAAAERFRDLAPRAIVFGYTTSSYLLGADADAAVRARLEGRAGGIPVVLPVPSAAQAFRALGAKRVALIHPPWFSEEVNGKGMEYFRNQGFDVLRCTRMAPARSFTEVRPVEVYDWVRANTPDNAQAVFIGGNGLRAVGGIDALETALSKPVLTANQVAFWAALRVSKVAAKISGYGRIFDVQG